MNETIWDRENVEEVAVEQKLRDRIAYLKSFEDRKSLDMVALLDEALRTIEVLRSALRASADD